ncbi:MAG: aspartyl protease family protein [candidate division Zixibacteria bacterium]|nr:aspartyl protease family protein [candidate division Zixibacteria bacterium]
MKNIIPFQVLAFLFILCSGTSWGITPEEILSQHLKALGGKENLLKIKTIYLQGKIKASGLEGEVVTYSELPDKSHQDIDFKIMQMSSGTDGKTYWSKDQNKKVRELGAVEKSSAWTKNYFAGYLYFFPEKYARELNYLGEGKDSLGEYHVLEIKPEGGESRKLFIHKDNFLLNRFTQKTVMGEATTYLSDYREIDGIKIPFLSQTTTGNPQYVNEIILTDVKFNQEVDPSIFNMPVEKVEDFTFSNPEKKTTVPFELINNHIYIEVLINGLHPGTFILDTGGGATIIDLNYAKKIGLEIKGKLEAKGVGGSVDAGLTELQSLQLGELAMSNQKITSIDLSFLNTSEGKEVRGILGYDFLSRFVFEIDYQNSRITFYQPDIFKYSGTGESLEIELYNKIPSAKATIDGEYKGLFILDTGSGKSLDLNSPFVEEYKLLQKYPEAIEGFGCAGAGGEAKFLQARIKSIQLGSFLINEPICGLSVGTEKGVFKNEQTQGVIGAGILKRFKVIFDYEGKKIILEKNDSFYVRDEMDKSGLEFILKEGKYLVDKVYDNTSAKKASIEPGEEIISINDEPASKYTLNQLRDLFTGKDGTIIKLQLKKIDKLREVSFKLKSLI